MPYYTKYHLSEHSADVLLGPIVAALDELERRTRHYVARVNVDAGSAERLTAAGDAIERARAEVERLLAATAAGSTAEESR